MKCFNHESVSNDNYEKIEFFGDKFINTYHTIALLNNRKDNLNEEDMSNMVGFLQSNIEQAKISNYYNLSEMLNYVGGELSYSIKSDILEAIVGTLYYTSEIAKPGFGFLYISNFLDYLYNHYEEDGFDYSLVEKKILKTEMLNMVRIREGESISLSKVSFQVKGGILHILYLHYLQKTFFTNFGTTYQTAFNKSLMITPDQEYQTFIFEDFLKNIRTGLKAELKETGNDYTTEKKIQKFDIDRDISEIIIPNYVIGFSINTDRRISEKDAYVNMRDNFESIGINPELVKNTKRELRLKKVLTKNNMFHDYISFKKKNGFLPEDRIFFKEYRKLREENSYTVSLFEIREGNKNLIHTLAGEDINMIETEILQYVFNSIN